MRRIFKSNFFIKLFHWEYWPFGIIQAPIFPLWIWYALKEKSIFYFSASNPGILTGGMMGESKYEVMQGIRDELKPRTFLQKIPVNLEEVKKLINNNDLMMPLIFKPDLGERGWMVRKIENEDDVKKYLQDTEIDFIVQEYVELPLEFAVYYIRFPSTDRGFVNSITMKEFLYVTGDGQSTLRELIFTNDRAKLQWEVLKGTYRMRLEEILPKNSRLELVPIGNHCLGTKFINANYLINDKLISSFDKISHEIKGFYFGRYDLRCASVEDLENGRIKIVELNGCGAEPAHIYQPGASILDAVKALLTHWQNMHRVSVENHARGIPYISFREGKEIYKRFKSLKS